MANYFHDNLMPNYNNSTYPNWFSIPDKRGRSETNSNKSDIFRQSEFYPIESLIIILFLAIVIIATIISKLAFATMDKKCENKYDLIIFKTSNQTKSSVFVGRKMFDNNVVIQHNVKAALEAGFDINRIKTMNIRRPSTFLQ